ncbi:hypothetical protein TCT1_13500 [Xenorhabdus sp. TCT-1]|uniref:DoxX family protein n=1 Tax=Xenorhabdus taiwanensis TaxID=3085177 RepID=A0ABM8JUQ3_9GAMM|nr:hypothetical protein TCT1_13500 [Xenorhabdus sp. TCT-1]
MADKRRTTIDILALVVTFFGFCGVFKTAAGMRNMMAKGAFHHNMSALFKMVPALLGNGTIIAN